MRFAPTRIGEDRTGTESTRTVFHRLNVAKSRMHAKSLVDLELLCDSLVRWQQLSPACVSEMTEVIENQRAKWFP
jgi:hypothetical protein